MKTINTRALVEGAVLAALTAMMGIFYNVPFLDVVTMFWPVPIIIVGYRNGFKVSLLAAFAAALLVGLINNPIIGVILFVTYALPGAIMGNMMKKNKSIYATLGAGGLILGITLGIEIILSLELVLGADILYILTHLGESLNSFYYLLLEQFKQASDIYRRLGFDEAAITQFVETFKLYLDWAIIRVPYALLATGLAVSYLNFKVVRLILNRTGHKIEDLKNFADWSLSKAAKRVLLAVTLAILLLMASKTTFLYIAYTNLWVLLMMTYFILGLSVVTYIMRRMFARMEMPRPVQVIFMFLMVLVMLRVLPYIGIFDLVADIRRIDRISTGGTK